MLIANVALLRLRGKFIDGQEPADEDETEVKKLLGNVFKNRQSYDIAF